jgi:hypothetical protein
LQRWLAGGQGVVGFGGDPLLVVDAYGFVDDPAIVGNPANDGRSPPWERRLFFSESDPFCGSSSSYSLQARLAGLPNLR